MMRSGWDMAVDTPVDEARWDANGFREADLGVEFERFCPLARESRTGGA
jgi:hypothetical protein